jgi:hypothetical protein
MNPPVFVSHDAKLSRDMDLFSVSVLSLVIVYSRLSRHSPFTHVVRRASEKRVFVEISETSLLLLI